MILYCCRAAALFYILFQKGLAAVGICFAFVSGKGGTGKSTVCAKTAKQVAKLNPTLKVLAVDFDIGLRSLDMLLGMQDKIVFDLGDVVKGNCTPENAVVKHGRTENLFLLCTPDDPQGVDIRAMLEAVKGLADDYDYIFLDLPAGIGMSVAVSRALKSKNIIVTTTDPISVRDGHKLLLKIGGSGYGVIINRVSAEGMLLNNIESLDEIVDAMGTPLLGVIGEDLWINAPLEFRKKQKQSAVTAQAFRAIAKRLCGQYAPLQITTVKK